jgi:hypothetical protein
MGDNKPNPRGWSYKPGSPLIRGFDTSALFREDCLLRKKWLSDGIAESQRKIEKTKGDLSEREKRTRKIKKELRAINRSLERTQSVGALPRSGQGLLGTVKITMTWHAFSELRRKYPDRVLNNMNAGRVLFTDTSVILHVPFSALGKTADTTLH